MKTVEKIIELFGGLPAVRKRSIRLEVEGFMPLVIESVGHGPRGYQLVSVAHYYVQEGDLMADPELTLEVAPDGWHPVSFTQANLGLYQEAVRQDDAGKVTINHKLVKDLQQFARLWGRNLKAQGFLEAARHLAGDPKTS